MKYRKWLWLVGFLVIGGPPIILTAVVQLENQDAFCASCHTQPESTYYERSLQAAQDLASAHAPAVGCIDCHSGAGVIGRLTSLEQGAYDFAAYLSGDYAQPAETHYPVGDQGCLKCHGVAGDDPFLKSHFHLQNYLAEWLRRSPNPAGTCVTCHVAHDVSGNPQYQHLNNLAVQATCETCHTDLSGWIP